MCILGWQGAYALRAREIVDAGEATDSEGWVGGGEGADLGVRPWPPRGDSPRLPGRPGASWRGALSRPRAPPRSPALSPPALPPSTPAPRQALPRLPEIRLKTCTARNPLGRVGADPGRTAQGQWAQDPSKVGGRRGRVAGSLAAPRRVRTAAPGRRWASSHGSAYAARRQKGQEGKMVTQLANSDKVTCDDGKGSGSDVGSSGDGGGMMSSSTPLPPWPEKEPTSLHPGVPLCVGASPCGLNGALPEDPFHSQQLGLARTSRSGSQAY